jgi:hypothetical protein
MNRQTVEKRRLHTPHEASFARGHILNQIAAIPYYGRYIQVKLNFAGLQGDGQRWGARMSEATIAMPTAASTADLDATTRRRAILSSAVGNFVELYDFLIYRLFGGFAAIISTVTLLLLKDRTNGPLD